MGGQQNLTQSSRLIELSAFGLYVSLIYKADKLGILCLIILCISAIFLPIFRKYLLSTLSLFAILYVAMATCTAFLVSSQEGIYRTVQFIILVFSTMVLSVYLTNISSDRRDLLARRFAILSALVFGHMILYHLVHGYLTTWKYLYDTKSVISISVLLLFYYEDPITRKYSRGGFYSFVLFLLVLILLSGERKAYILFAIVYLLSREALALKVAVVLAGAAAIAAFAALAPPSSYVARQIDSLVKPKPTMQISEFYGIQNIGDQSDIIRDFVNRMAREQFNAHPILGLGATGYQQWSKANFGLATDSRGLAMNVHGEINRIPVEGGLIGIMVAAIYYLCLISAVSRDYLIRRATGDSSRARAPLYVLSFLTIYASVEALDTFMLELVLLFGFVMAAREASSSGKKYLARKDYLEKKRRNDWLSRHG